MDKATLDKINALTRREFKASELYTFPVTVCGNEIDRDLERFSDKALDELAPMLVGKTIIADHNPTTENQIARLYDTAVVEARAALTKDGRLYRYLKGFAYMVRTEENASLIAEIDAGIKKEVSVGCSVLHRICSVCGKDVTADPCEHRKGHTYDGQLCYHILDGVTDAYELSFTPVPAQPDAGVTKTYKGGIKMEQEFTPITTQKDFDAAVQQAVDAAVTAKAAEFEGWVSPEEHQKALDDLETAHKSALLGAYRAKAALLAGLPEELADRLNGDTEEDIMKDAQSLAALTKCGETPHFEAGGAKSPANSTDAALLEVLDHLN